MLNCSIVYRNMLVSFDKRPHQMQKNTKKHIGTFLGVCRCRFKEVLLNGNYPD